MSLTILNDIPAGSGLGSSSLFCVSLTKAFFEMLSLQKSKMEHLKIVKNIEIKELKKSNWSTRLFTRNIWWF